MRYAADLVRERPPVRELLPAAEVADPGSLPRGCLVLVQQHFQAHPDRPNPFHLPRMLAVYRAQLTWSNPEVTRTRQPPSRRRWPAP